MRRRASRTLSARCKRSVRSAGVIGTHRVYGPRRPCGDASSPRRTNSDPELGLARAKTLGDHPAALLRGHGRVVLGSTLPLAVGRSISTEIYAKLQMQAMALPGRLTTTCCSFLIRVSGLPDTIGFVVA